jgi:hypothetical protein
MKKVPLTCTRSPADVGPGPLALSKVRQPGIEMLALDGLSSGGRLRCVLLPASRILVINVLLTDVAIDEAKPERYIPPKNRKVSYL